MGDEVRGNRVAARAGKSAKAKGGRRAAKSARPARGVFGRLRRRVARGLFLLLALWLAWVGLWRIADLPGGAYLASEWWRLGGVEREARGLERISPDLARAVVAAEDARFCSHWGLDLDAIEQAIEDRAEGRIRGASTITQQVVKNVFLWHGPSWTRKGIEAVMAPVAGTLWGKRRTLEIYLNVAEFGEGVFGAEAAARYYFGRSAQALTLTQASRLAVLLPNPKARDPNRLSGSLRARAARVAEGARTIAARGDDACFAR